MNLQPSVSLATDELISLVAQRRVIPFIGAGVSAGLGYPTWDELLRKVTDKLDLAISYEELSALTNNDPLQIAEYLFLKSYRNIGPLRHIIEGELPAVDVMRSGVHVELVNLGASQIYTTNFDDLIEDTFHLLGLPVNKVALPRDVATANSEVPQVVKYHGDLRHDETLVFTESSYYSRLDFESPMDLKFRSDLLGKSVLFMGYSFRDINIRVIWFKLTKMMRDIPEDDRLPSYMVRLQSNPVLEELDRAAGLRTLVLDPDGIADTDLARASLLARFLNQLASGASTNSCIPGQTDAMFASSWLLDSLQAWLDRTPRGRAQPTVGIPILRDLLARRVPAGLDRRAKELVEGSLLIPRGGIDSDLLEPILTKYGPSSGLTVLALNAMMTTWRYGECPVFPPEFWASLWSTELTDTQVNSFLERLQSEVSYHEREPPDDDIVFASDIVARFALGQIAVSPEAKQRAELLLANAAAIYSAIANHVPEDPPDYSAVISQVEYAIAEAEGPHEAVELGADGSSEAEA